jgi:hypothetical protein
MKAKITKLGRSRLGRATILASEIPRRNPDEVLKLAARAMTSKEMAMFIKLGVCENIENECPVWIRQCTPEQRAALCSHAAQHAPIVSGKKFWPRLKLLLNGSANFRIIGV